MEPKLSHFCKVVELVVEKDLVAKDVHVGGGIIWWIKAHVGICETLFNDHHDLIRHRIGSCNSVWHGTLAVKQCEQSIYYKAKTKKNGQNHPLTLQMFSSL